MEAKLLRRRAADQSRQSVGDNRVAVVELGRRLRSARKAKNLSQAEVGEALELTSHSPIGQWERGAVLAESINLILVAQLYGESLDWLVFGMKSSIEKRISALPESLRDLTMAQITSALEGAERAMRTNPKLFGGEFVADSDPRLTVWSAANKPKRATPKGKGKPKP